MKQRIYLVTNGTERRLVRAPNRTRAINHVAAVSIAATVPSQEELFAAAQAGMKIEDCRPGDESEAGEE